MFKRETSTYNDSRVMSIMITLMVNLVKRYHAYIIFMDGTVSFRCSFVNYRSGLYVVAIKFIGARVYLYYKTPNGISLMIVAVDPYVSLLSFHRGSFFPFIDHDCQRMN